MKKKYYINDLDCAACASNLEEQINKLNGIKKAQVNFLKKTLEIEFHEKDIIKKEQEIKQLIHKLEPDVSLEEKKIEVFSIDHKKIYQILLAILFFIIAILFPSKISIIKTSLYLISYGIVGLCKCKRK